MEFIQEESYRTHEVLRIGYTGKIPYIRVNQYLTGAMFQVTRELLQTKEDWDSLEMSQFFTNMAVRGIFAFLGKVPPFKSDPPSLE